MKTLVLAFIGDDEPGLVHALAEVLSDHGGNWETSQMGCLGHLFAGTLQVSVHAERADALVEDFRGLDGMLQVTVRAMSALAPEVVHETDSTFTLDIDGGDHPGIVEAIAAALARPRVNVRRFSSCLREDAEGQRTFHVTALLAAQADLDLDELGDDLRALADDLRVGLTLGLPARR